MYRALKQLAVSYRRIEAFASCGTSWWVLESRTRPGVYRLAPDFCHDRWCVPCAHLRADLVTGNLLSTLRSRPTRLLTLTLRSTDHPLRLQVHRLIACFRRLRLLPLFARATDGGLAVLEITYDPDTTRYHPHLHVLCDGRFIAQAALANEWERITGDSRIVDIRYISRPDHAAKYVTKYLTKPIDHAIYHSEPGLKEAIEALKGTKQLITFGTWRKLHLLKPLREDDWRSLGHWHELISGYGPKAEAHAALTTALKLQPNVAMQAEFTAADLSLDTS